jgi:hypothetical protein
MNAEQLSKRIADLEAQVVAARESFPTMDALPDDEAKGSNLLHAFLTDTPFDRYIFALKPIKVAFLIAAFHTGDPEIIVSSLFLVKQTLTKESYDDLLDSVPQFRQAYDAFNKSVPLTSLRPNLPPSDRRAVLLAAKPKSSSLMGKVIDQELQRMETPGKNTIGFEAVDLKWIEFCSVRGNPSVRADSFVPKMALMNKWLKSMDPYQAALMGRAWGMPEHVWRKLATEVTDKADRESLIKRGMLAPSSK